jgi:hypothetical protein
MSLIPILFHCSDGETPPEDKKEIQSDDSKDKGGQTGPLPPRVAAVTHHHGTLAHKTTAPPHARTHDDRAGGNPRGNAAARSSGYGVSWFLGAGPTRGAELKFMSAFEGTADIDRHLAQITCDATDPNRSLCGRFCCDARP